MNNIVADMEPADCVVCIKPLNVTIMRCGNDHNVCEDCANRINFCPVCRSKVHIPENFVLKNVFSTSTEVDIKLTVDTEVEENNANPDNIPHNDIGVSNNPILYPVQLECWNTLTLNDITASRINSQLIPFGKELFWYKHKIDTEKREMYWTLQYIERKKKDISYYYEVMLKPTAVSQAVKFWELCESDKKSMDDLIAARKCITMPFNMMESHAVENKIQFKVHVCKIVIEWTLRDPPNDQSEEREEQGIDPPNQSNRRQHARSGRTALPPPVLAENAPIVRPWTGGLNSTQNRLQPLCTATHLPSYHINPAAAPPAYVPGYPALVWMPVLGPQNLPL